MMKKLLAIAVLLLSVCSQNTEQPVGTSAGTTVTEEQTEMSKFDFSQFPNVELINADTSEMSDEQLSVLYQQARYCQAMTDADIDTMRGIVSEDMIFTHMSGRQQTCEEYFADIVNGRLTYYTIGIENPVITVDGDSATIKYTSVLNANAYGARGTFRMPGTHDYRKINGEWTAVNRER